MVLTIVAILVLLWVIGLIANVGAIVHVLLIAALVVFIWDRLVAHRGV